MNLEELQIFFCEFDLLRLKRKLNTYYITLNPTEKNDFLDEIELSYLLNGIDFIVGKFECQIPKNKQELIVVWINEKRDQLETETKPNQKEIPIENNKHDNIFCNNGFKLFEYLLENFAKPKNQKGHQKDILFCYHKLYNENKQPNYIHQRTQSFLDWYNPLYSDEISQTKTFDEVKTTNREKLYSSTLALFKQQK